MHCTGPFAASTFSPTITLGANGSAGPSAAAGVDAVPPFAAVGEPLDALADVLLVALVVVALVVVALVVVALVVVVVVVVVVELVVLEVDVVLGGGGGGGGMVW